MSSHLRVAVLSEALHHFGAAAMLDPDQRPAIVRWIRTREREIEHGAQTVAHPTLPRAIERSWYETDREPGEEG